MSWSWLCNKFSATNLVERADVISIRVDMCPKLLRGRIKLGHGVQLEHQIPLSLPVIGECRVYWSSKQNVFHSILGSCWNPKPCTLAARWIFLGFLFQCAHLTVICRFELSPEKWMLLYPNLPKMVGSDWLEARIRSIHGLNGSLTACHIFGHTHFVWDTTLDGVRSIFWNPTWFAGIQVPPIK